MKEYVFKDTSITKLQDFEEVEVPVTIQGNIDYSVDKDYSSDSDGNRSVMKVFVNGIDDFEVYDENGDDIKLSENEIENLQDELIDKFYGR